MAYNFTYNTCQAEDLVQDLYLKIGDLVARRKKTPREMLYKSQPNVYFAFCLMRNNHINNSKHERRYQYEYNPQTDERTCEQITTFTRDSIREKVNDLPVRQQRVYQLAIEAGHTIQSIADQTGYKYSTIHVDKVKIKRMLQTWLEEEGAKG